MSELSVSNNLASSGSMSYGESGPEKNSNDELRKVKMNSLFQGDDPRLQSTGAFMAVNMNSIWVNS